MTDWKKFAMTWTASTLVGFYSVFVLMEVWNWFAVPLLHVSETSYWLMYRVSMLFGLMTGAGIRGSLAHLKALRLIRQLPPEEREALRVLQEKRAANGVGIPMGRRMVEKHWNNLPLASTGKR